jgi:hypothetical protein
MGRCWPRQTDCMFENIYDAFPRTTLACLPACLPAALFLLPEGMLAIAANNLCWPQQEKNQIHIARAKIQRRFNHLYATWQPCLFHRRRLLRAAYPVSRPIPGKQEDISRAPTKPRDCVNQTARFRYLSLAFGYSFF